MVTPSAPASDAMGLTLEVFLAFANLEEAWRVASSDCDATGVAAARDRCVAEWRERVTARLDALLPELSIALALTTPEDRAAAASLRSRLLGPWVIGPRRRPLARLLAGDPIGAAVFGMPEERDGESPLDVLLREYTCAFRPAAR